LGVMKIPAILVALLCIAGALYLFADNRVSFPDKTQPAQQESAGFEADGDKVITPLYFVSYGEGSTTPNCAAAKDINWDLAVVIMSDYWQYGVGSTSADIDLEPMGIQRSFNEHCQRNMGIYNEAIAKNPDLLSQ